MKNRNVTLFFTFIILFVLLFGGIVALAWNATMPHLFGLPTIGVGKGIALYLLIRILFGGIRSSFVKGE